MEKLRKLNFGPHTLKKCKLSPHHPLSYMIICLKYLYTYEYTPQCFDKKTHNSTALRETMTAPLSNLSDNVTVLRGYKNCCHFVAL